MTRNVRTKDAAPPDRCGGQDMPRTGSTTQLSLSCGVGIGYRTPWQRDSTTRAGPVTIQEEVSMDIASPAVIMVASAHHLITPASVTGRPRPNLGNTPLTGCAVLLAGAMQGRHEFALQIRDVGPDGQDRR